MTARITYLILSSMTLLVQLSFGQESTALSEILQLVKQKSNAVKTAAYQLNIAEEETNFFNSKLKPQISLNALLPNYNKTSSPIIQPDGTIAFQSIRQGSSTLSLSATQVIAKTGGLFYVNSDLQRFDDFSTEFKTYNGIPLRVGFSQNLFAYNPWAAEKTLQALNLQEASLTYNIQLEEALQTGTQLYFDILIAQQNLEIARTNEKVNKELILITKERLQLGKVSKDEMLQLEIQLINSQLAASQAENILFETKYQLSTFLGEKDLVYDIYLEPELSAQTTIDYKELNKNSLQNRPEVIAHQKAILIANNETAKAKSDFGFQASVNASIGLARGSTTLQEIYQDPFTEQQFNISLNLPIIDWGMRKYAVSIAKIQGESAIDNQTQLLIEIENEIQQSAARFDRIQKNLDLLRSIMEKSELRFKISNERYILGNIDITNLTIAQSEKDSNKRNYINALRTYWLSYSQLRLLTGYDILTNQKINQI